MARGMSKIRRGERVELPDVVTVPATTLTLALVILLPRRFMRHFIRDCHYACRDSDVAPLPLVLPFQRAL